MTFKQPEEIKVEHVTYLNSIKNIFVKKRDKIERRTDIENPKFNETNENLLEESKRYNDDFIYHDKSKFSLPNIEEDKEEHDLHTYVSNYWPNDLSWYEDSGSKMKQGTSWIDESMSSPRADLNSKF